jgi:hypothetical protein
MHGAIPPLPSTPSWRGTLLNTRTTLHLPTSSIRNPRTRLAMVMETKKKVIYPSEMWQSLNIWNIAKSKLNQIDGG